MEARAPVLVCQRWHPWISERNHSVTLRKGELDIFGSDIWHDLEDTAEWRSRRGDKTLANSGPAHYCLFADSRDELYADLKANGIEFFSEAQPPTAGPIKCRRDAVMKEPRGVRVELVELAESEVIGGGTWSTA